MPCTRRPSAGRVQSVALRLVCEREAELEAFVPQASWTVEAELALTQHSDSAAGNVAVASASAAAVAAPRPGRRGRSQAPGEDATALAAASATAGDGSSTSSSSNSLVTFRAALTHVDGKRYVPGNVTDEATAQALVQRVRDARLKVTNYQLTCQLLC